jgi:PEP-CTERM motif
MIERQEIRSLLSSLLVMSSLIAGVGTADAASYRGRIDPAYGTPFPDLGWRGEIKVDVPDSCIAPGWVDNVAGCGSQMAFDFAKIEFYSLSDPGQTTQETLDFSGSIVLSMNFQILNNTELTGVNATPFVPVLSKNEGVYYSLALLGDHAQLFWFKDDPGPFQNNSGAYFACSKVSDSGCGWSTPVNGDRGPFIIFSPIPEPGTTAMMLLGAGVLGWAARRRRAAR